MLNLEDQLRCERDCTRLYHAPAGKDAQLPLPVSAPMVVDYIDDYVLTAAGWRILHRRTTIVFQP